MYPVADTWCISQNQYNIVKKKKTNKNKIKSHQYFKKSGVLPVTLVNLRYLYFYGIFLKFQLIFTIFNYQELKVS